MSLNDQYEHGRIPLRPLAYANKDLAQTNELVVDYGKNGTYHIYISDSEDPSILIDFTDKIIREVLPTATINANQFKISIEGIQEPTALRDIINHIYKRYVYADNENGFLFNNKDIAKVYDPNTKSVLLRNDDGTIMLPVTTIDNVLDTSGVSMQERLNSSTRFSCSYSVIDIEDITENEFNFLYPYKNYNEAIQVYIGGTYLSPDQYSIVNDIDINEEYTTGTIVLHDTSESYLNIFINSERENDYKLIVFFMYNTITPPTGEYGYMHGSNIANKTISALKLEKTTDNYLIDDSNMIPTSKALHNLYSDLSNTFATTDGIHEVWSVDSGDNTNITVQMPDEILNSNDPVIVHTATKCQKNSNCYMVFSNYNRTSSKTFDNSIKFPDFSNISRPIPANRPLTLIVYNRVPLSNYYPKGAYILEGLNKETIVNRYIVVCTSGQTDIVYTGLDYSYDGNIMVYRNGIRLFENIDYTLNTSTETITLLTEAEDGEKIVFEYIGY